MSLQISFLGAAGTVTGSKFLVEADQHKVLIDCGMFQGIKELRLQNWDPFPIDPATLDAIVISHAHLDHCGYLPRLVRQGFVGKIYLTKYSAALARIILRDSAKIQMEDAEFARLKGFSKHNPPLPLYSDDDAEAAIELFVEVDFRKPTKIAAAAEVEFLPSGHILGAAFVQLNVANKKLIFSGDLGRPEHPILAPPDPIEDQYFDAVVVESTYGDLRHEDPGSLLADTINKTISRGGTVLIPAFAVDRTEVLLMQLKELLEAGAIPKVPIFVDSPMASAALDCYRDAIAQDSPEIKAEIRKLSRDIDVFALDNLFETRSANESKALNGLKKPAIIIAASGMATGGRVVHHLARLLPDAKNSVILVGFQAPGTRGRSLLDGSASIKMHGAEVAVAAEIIYLPGLSVHADQAELLGWLSTITAAPKQVFVVHGETDAATVFADQIRTKYGWQVEIPTYQSKFTL
jgi:metallo-beta-lactamase family protein